MTILKVFHVLVSLILIAGVLLQSGKSAGLSGAIDGGATAVFGKKRKGMDELLAKVTTIAAIAFIVLSVLIAAL